MAEWLTNCGGCPGTNCTEEVEAPDWSIRNNYQGGSHPYPSVSADWYAVEHVSTTFLYGEHTKKWLQLCSAV